LGDSHFTVTAPGFSPFVVNVTIRSEVDTLDLATQPFPSSQQPKPAKRRWWQIF
jgi:hypothetical protein